MVVAPVDLSTGDVGTFAPMVRSTARMKMFPILLAFAASVPVVAQTGDDAMLAGLSALKKSDHASAAMAFDRAITEAPTNGKAWYYRAVNRLVLGDHDGALHDLDHLLVLEPRDAHAMLRRAEVYRIKGDLRMAKTDLYRVLGVHANGPAAEHALLELGRMSLAENDLPSALGHYDRLVEIAGYNAMAWCDRGIVLSLLRDDERAIADLEKAVELDPTLDQAYFQLAVVLFRQDRKQEACYALQQAHDLGDRSVEELMLVHCDR